LLFVFQGYFHVFLGNSHYFGYLKNLNFFIKKYDVHIHQNTTGNGQDALEGTGLHSTPKWLSKSAMVNDLSLRLTDDNYNDLINRLNTLYPIQGLYLVVSESQLND
jgi:hypothetical protein